MVCRVKDIMEIMEEIAPKSYAKSWDNVGLLLGSQESNVRKVMVVMDVTPCIVDEAIEKKVDMIIAHHPIIFNPIRRVVDKDTEGQLIIKLLCEKIALFAAHTNLDMAKGGIDDSLAKTLELKNVHLLNPLSEGEVQKPGFGRWGELEKPMTLEEFGEYVKGKLPNANIAIVGKENKPIRRVALCGGSGGDFINDGIKVEADIFVTGEMKYHKVLSAYMDSICVMTLGHFHSEMPGMELLTRRLQKTMDSLQYKVEIIFTENKDPYPGIFVN